MAKENADNIDAASNDTASGEEIQVQLIDGVCVVTTNDVSSTLSSPIVIEKPAAGQTTEIDVVGGQKYLFDFSENNVESFVQEGDDLTLSFADGSSILLAGFGTAAASAIPSSLAFTGDMTAEELRQLIRVVSNEPQTEELQAVEDEPQSEVRGEEQADAGDAAGGEEDSGAQQLAAVEPAAGEEISAEDLAQIEPAAGDGNTGGGAADAGGAGFQSSFTPQGVLGLEDVGPIGPTALQYRIPEFSEDIFVEEQEVDDVPQILSPDALDLDETNLGPLSQTGNVNVDFGNDGPGTIAPDGSFSSGGSQTGGTLTSNGNLIDVQPTADGYVGTINGGADTVFEITINPNTGEFEFTQFLAIDHADGTNPDDVITLNFGVVATDADGDAANAEIVVNIADDAPATAAPDSNTVNEAALSGGPIVVNDGLVIDFGNDGPGAVAPNGTTNVTGVTTLTSGGQPITITQTADGYVGTLPGGGVAFELTIDPATGSYTYTQNVGIDHNPALDTITLDFGVNVTDFDTDSTSTTISINILDSVPEINDKPKLGDGLEVVDETDLPGVTTSGKLTVDFGGDTPGAVTANDTFTSDGSQLGGNLTSNGVPVVVNLVGDTYIGTAGPDTIFTLQVGTDGSYTFNLIGTLDHADPDDPNDIINLNFGVTATDADGDTDSTTIIVKVKDDVPVIGDAAGDVDESNLDGGPISTSDTIFTSFGTEVGSIAPNGTVSSEAGGAPIALTSNGNAITITQTADGYVGTVNGGADTVFTITVDSQTGQYTYTQFDTLDHPDGTDPNDTIELSFGVAVTSTDGDSDSGTITISVGDDGPIANDDVSGAEEGQLITGNLVANDDLSQDVENTVTNVNHNGTDYPIAPGGSVDITTALGSISINSDGTYTYIATDIGDPDGTDVFTYTLTDGDNDSDPATLSIRVTPDGEPIAVTETMTVDETNLTPGPLVINETVAIDFGLDGQGSFDPNGSFDFGGSALNNLLTSGGQPVDVQATADGYVGVIAGTTTKVFELIAQDNGDYSFELFNTLDHADDTDPNDNIVLNFGMTVADSDGDTADGTITINVLDDAPVAFDDFNSVPQNQLTANGNVTNNDIDGEDAPSDVTSISFNGTDVPVVNGVPTVINGDYGTLSINSDGTYTYTSFGTNTTAVTDVFTYSLTDFDGDTDTAELTINIVDVDDKPEIQVAPLVTDESDLNPTDTDSSTIVANFGNDGPGTFTVTGTGTFGFSGATNNALTSNDVPVDVNVVGNDYVGTANGSEVFRLTLNETTGEYEFILSGPLDHADTTDPDDAIELTFGVTATDADGDIDTGSIVVQVKDDGPEANDDTNMYDTTFGVADGNVITGRNGGPGAADDLSEDNAAPESADHDVVEVSFGGTTVAVPEGGSTTIDGQFGTLTIFDNGEYTYTLNPNAPLPTTTTSALNPSAGDVAGTQESFSQNGITISVANAGDFDITWLDTADGSGLGINNLNSGDSTKVWPKGETFDIDLAAAATQVELTIAEIGNNNDDGNHGVDYTITFSDGTTATGEQQFVPNEINGGVFSFTIDSADYAGKTISSIALNSTDGGQYAGASFLLNNVVATHEGEDCIIDQFEYVLQDGDGDQDTATLTFKGKDLTDDQPELTTSDVTVDETDLNPTDDASNTVTADFGNDVAGDITVTGAGTFNFNGAENNALTSNGVPVTVTTQGTDTYVGTAGTETVFTLVVQPDGQYTFTLIGTLDHADETNPDDVIQLFFDVTATDGDGDTDTGTITVNVKDDGPYINTKAAAIDEDGLANNASISYTRTLVHDYGEDGAGEINPDGTFMALFQMGGQNQTLTSDGEEIIVTQTADGYVGETAGGRTIFTVEVQNNGQYTYTQFDGIDHPDDTNPDDVIWLKFGVEIVDFDGDTDTAFIQVDVHDAAPTAPNNSVFPVAEHGLENGPVVVMKNFNGGDFGGDGEGQYEYNGTFMLLGNSSTQTGELTSGGEKIDVTFNGNIATGELADGTVVFTMELDPATGKHTFTLFEPVDHGKPDASGAQDVAWIKFGVDIVDADGDRDTAMIQVDIRDDAPAANDDCNEFSIEATNQDFNIVMALDVSGSMGGNKLALLKSSVANLLTDFGDYNGGEIKVHLVPFATDAGAGETFTVTDQAGFDAAIAYINGLNASGTTNYEAPLQSAIDWLNGATANDPIAGADTYTYFVSDGEPNRYLNTNDQSTSGNADTVMDEITGSDGSNEVAILQGLSTEVIGVGIGVNGTTLARLGQIDSDGTALDVQDPTDLDAMLQGTNPVTGQTTGNVITGLNGGAGAADDLSQDVDNTVTKIAFGGNVVDVDPVNGAQIDGAYGRLTINSDGSYTYKITAQNITADILEEFTYTLVDGDGDVTTAELLLKGTYTHDDQPELTTSDVTVDETALNPTDDASNSVSANFGADGPGEITVSGANTFGFSGAENNALTSNGVPVSVTTVGNSYVGKAGTETIFTLDLNKDTGDYTFTLHGTLDHADETNPDDIIALTFGVTATDGDGDTDTGNITVNVKDDGPSISGRASAIDEDGLATNASISYTRTLTHDYGEDGAGEIRPTDTFMATYSMGGNAQTITSDGVTVDIQTTANGYVGKANGQTVFTLEVQTNGQYTYTQYAGLDHPDTNNDDDVMWLKFGVEIVDFDGDTAPATITVDVHDAAPTAPNNSVFPVTEHGLENGPVVVMRNFNGGDFGGDGEGQYEYNGTFMLLGNSSTATDELTSGGEKVDVTFNGNVATGATAAGTVVFTMTLDPATGKHTFTLFEPLDHGKPDASGSADVVWAKFGVDIVDADGDRDSAMIQVDIRDDAPEAGSNSVFPVSEKGLENGPVDVTRNFNGGDFHGDGEGQYEFNGTFMLLGNSSTATDELTSGGQKVDVIFNGNVATGATAAGTVVFTMTLDPATGQHTFTLFEPLDHGKPDASGSADVVWAKFGVDIVDNDGDRDSTMIQVDIRDDAPDAKDDSETFAGEDGGVDGDVVENDDLSADTPNTVTQIKFGAQSIDVPNDGSNTTIDGQFGTLTINNTGAYSYELFDNAYDMDTSYTFTKFNPPGSDNGGDIKKVETSYNDTSHTLNFEMVIDQVADGFTLALNNGPNPKGHGGELALLYFDASGAEPIITVYAYNGANTQTSYKDGSAAGGTQAPDKILSSITDPDAFDITVTTDGNGNKVFSFEMDASSIQAHDPAYGPNGDWTGVAFDQELGIWLHPVKNLDTTYELDGFLCHWEGQQGYYDTSNQKTVSEKTFDGETKDVFEYTLTDSDGDSDTATLTLESDAPAGSLFTGSSYADYIEGTTEADTIIGGQGNDTLYGGDGADTFLYQAINEGVDTIKDFDAGEGDQLDVSALLQGFDVLQDSINEFVFTNEDNGNTEVFVDQTGSGNAANATQIAVLEAVTGLSAEDIVGDSNSQTTV